MRRAVFLLLLVTGCYDDPGTPVPGGNSAVPNLTLQELRSLYTGYPFEVTKELSVEGIVTTSDRSDNFYRTFCIEQEGAAVEIMAGSDHLFNTYPIGCRVVVRLSGLTVGMHYGVLQIGRKSAAGSGFPTGYLGSPAALAKAVIRRGEDLSPPRPALYDLESLTAEACGRLVRIEGLRYAPEELDINTWAGYKRFTDAGGNELFAYTRDYARWASNPLPAGEVSLTGILQTGTAGYILKLRDENDCTD